MKLNRESIYFGIFLLLLEISGCHSTSSSGSKNSSTSDSAHSSELPPQNNSSASIQPVPEQASITVSTKPEEVPNVKPDMNLPTSPPTPEIDTKIKTCSATLLECRFNEPPTQKKSDPNFAQKTCIAVARICEKDAECQSQTCRNELTVLCGGQNIYSDRFTHLSIGSFEELIGILDHSPFIILAYPKIQTDHFPIYMDSKLKIGDEELEGSCEAKLFTYHIDCISKENKCELKQSE